MKNALIVRHVPREGIAGFRQPIEASGYVLHQIDVGDAGFESADLISPDLVIMMGGPMGVYEQDKYPWIPIQTTKLRERIAAGCPTLGVCFGAQMIAAAMGATVVKGDNGLELGFSALTLTTAGANSPARHLDGVPVLHWHGDTFNLPDSAELLASTAMYPHQVFRAGPNVLALQCHAEMGEDPRFEDWLSHFWEDFHTCGMKDWEMRVAHAQYGPGAVAAGRAMIAEWLAQIDLNEGTG